MNVDTPLSWLSLAPTRAKMLSTIDTSADWQGTKQPSCAMTTTTPVWGEWEKERLNQQCLHFRHEFLQCWLHEAFCQQHGTYLTNIGWFATHVWSCDDVEHTLLYQQANKQSQMLAQRRHFQQQDAESKLTIDLINKQESNCSDRWTVMRSVEILWDITHLNNCN